VECRSPPQPLFSLSRREFHSSVFPSRRQSRNLFSSTAAVGLFPRDGNAQEFSFGHSQVEFARMFPLGGQETSSPSSPDGRPSFPQLLICIRIQGSDELFRRSPRFRRFPAATAFPSARPPPPLRGDLPSWKSLPPCRAPLFFLNPPPSRKERWFFSFLQNYRPCFLPPPRFSSPARCGKF